MVTVVSYAVRQNQEGQSFVVLVLQGDLEIIKSQTTGKFYATSKKCSIMSTFSEQIAATMVGQKIPGAIVKQECEPYNYTIPETGESVVLSYRWEYTQDPLGEMLKADLRTFSTNGKMVEA